MNVGYPSTTPTITRLDALLYAALLSLSFVCAFYLTKSKLHRDDPRTIRFRFMVSVGVSLMALGAWRVFMKETGPV